MPDGAVMVGTDQEAREVLERARRDRAPFPPLGLLGGDLWRTLGGAGDRVESERRIRAGEGVRFDIDVGEVLVEGRLRLFVAHLVARSRLWTRTFLAMNAQWLGDWNAGPRAHPGDGLLDTYDARLRLSRMPAVRSRLHLGAHLPHPDIKERRVPAVQVEFDKPLAVRLDGAVVGTARSLAVRVEPDAVLVVV